MAKKLLRVWAKGREGEAPHLARPGLNPEGAFRIEGWKVQVLHIYTSLGETTQSGHPSFLSASESSLTKSQR